MYCFLPFSLIWKTLSKIMKESPRAPLITPLRNTNSWFPMILRNGIKTPITCSSQHLVLPGTSSKHPLYPRTKLVAFLLSKKNRAQDIPESTKEIILASWRTTTKNRYNITYRKWQEFCSERNINNIQTFVNDVISFFSLLYHQGQGSRSICNAKSVLNNIT